jgi:hypothetical protein
MLPIGNLGTLASQVQHGLLGRIERADAHSQQRVRPCVPLQ